MASTDATAIPIKNQAYRVTFPIWDADGDLVTGAAGLDSEVSKDGGTFTDCTNEATEIATSSGIYYLDLSATEMNADTVAVIVKTSTSGAKTTALVFYPAEAGDIIVNVKQINGTNQTARDIGASVLLAADQAVNVTKWNSQSVHAVSENGVPVVDVHKWNGTDVSAPSTAGIPEVNVKNIANAAVSTSTAQIGVNVVNAGGTAWGSGAITAASIANGAIDNATFAADVGSTAYATNIIALAADKAIQNAALATAAELAKVPKSDGSASWNATALAAINAEVDTALNTAIPGSPVANSINERIATMDGLLLGTIAAGTHNPQSGDAYAIVNNGTYGNNALKTLIDTVDNFIDTEVAAILADTNELQTDWHDGGRLDLLIDAIKAKTDSLTFTVAGDVDVNVQSWKGSAAPDMTGDAYARLGAPAGASVSVDVAAIKAQTAAIEVDTQDLQTQIGTDGAGLTNIPWNAAWDTEVQSECTDALNAYDPPTKAEMDSAFATTDGKIDVIDGIVDDILVDTGTTLPGTLSTLSTAVSGVAAAVWNYLTAAMTTVDSIGKALADWLPGTAAGAPPYTASVVAICNNALLMLGNNAITALTDDTKAAKLCAQFYQLALDSVLRAYTWNCATVRSAALAATTTPTFGFSYAFTLPDDCLRVLTIEDDQAIPFKVENGVLLTDESTCKISYLKRIAPDDADSLLLEAISARLAATIAFPLTNSTSAAEAMWKLYEKKLDEAQSVDAFEGTAPQMASDDWINSRS